MTASFGKLEQETLTLGPGLNLLSRPNEAGKSTWAAFLLAMFYGIDTTERAKQGMLPAKTKYKPWSGQPMQGTLLLETGDGRRIRLERTSRGRTPMGEFAAYDADTGLRIESLTADNCGVTLLGVERSVFARSAFLHQSQLAVTADGALERRLSSLVTTGDERASASAAGQLLREQRNQIQHNKTGLLPQALAERQQLLDTLSQLQQLHRQDLALRAQADELSAQLSSLALAEQALRAQAQAQKQAQLSQARAQVQAGEQALSAAQEKTRRYPPRETISALRESLLDKQDTQDAPLPQPPEVPACPPVFQGVAPDQLLDKAQRDGREFDRLTAKKRPSLLPPAVALIAAVIAAAVFAALAKYPVCAVWVVCALAALWQLVRTKRAIRAYERNMDAAQAILLQYENRSRDAFTAFAAQYREQLLVYEQKRAAYQAALAERQSRAQARTEQTARVFGALSVFAPDARDVPSALHALEQAEADWRALDAAAGALALARSRAETLQTAYGALAPVPMPPGDWTGLDAGQIARERAEAERQLRSLRSRLDQSQGHAAAMGDAAAMTARVEALDAEIDALRRRYAAIELAEQTMQAAAEELQTRFAPQLAARAGAYLAAMTENRYDRVLLDRQLSLAAMPAGQAGLVGPLSLSTGTAGQLYLAVRLAICDLALPKDAPLILDDALVSFDDARMAAALRLLRGQERQVLLFTCQSREARWLSSQTQA